MQSFSMNTRSNFSQLTLKPLEPVRHCRTVFTLIRELRNEQCERLRISRNSQRAAIYRIKADVTGGPSFLAAPI